MSDNPSQERPTVNREHLRLLIESTVDAQLDARFAEMRKHMDAGTTELKEYIKSAFPDGDMHGHRKAHAAMIKLADERAARWNKLWERIVVGGGYSLAVAIGLALWDAFKGSLK